MISGPSSCGKSTFIENFPLRKVGFPSENLPVFFPNKLLRQDSPGDYQNAILHYNILRPYPLYDESRSDQYVKNGYNKYIKKLTSFLWKNKQQHHSWEELKSAWDYQRDPFFAYLNKLEIQLKVIVLVANKDLIKQRMRKRSLLEERRFSDSERPYPRSYWLNILNQLDLLDVYNIWLNFLQQNQIEYQLHNSNTMEYEQLNSPDDIVKILYGEKHAM